MTSLRAAAFFAASVAAHLAIGALLVRTTDSERAVAPSKLTGETLSMPEDVVTEGVEGPVRSATAGVREAPDQPRGRGAKAVARGAVAETHAASPSGGAVPLDTGTYGAVGDRAASDISSAFTRAFPQAASADPVWLEVPFGRAGSALVSIEIDETGTFVQARIDDHASPALRRGIERTVALIRGRTFTAQWAITRLSVSATVSPDDVHDGLHGDVFAIGGTFERHQGNAFFALAAGRRIDLSVRGK